MENAGTSGGVDGRYITYKEEQGLQAFRIEGLYIPTATDTDFQNIGLSGENSFVRVKGISAAAYNELTDENKKKYTIGADGNYYNYTDPDATLLASVAMGSESINGKYPGVVTLYKDAFDTSATAVDQTITFSDFDTTDTRDYSLSFADDFATTSQTISQSFAGSNGSYTFTNAGSGAYFSTDTNSATYHAKTGGQSFSISGLSENLTEAQFLASASVASDGTVTLNDVSILGSISLGGSKAITLTDNIGALDGNAGNQINFSLAFGDAFKTSAEQIDATFVKGDEAGKYTFSAAHSGAYVTGGDSTTIDNTVTWNWIYNQEAQYDQVTFTGLTALTANDYALNPAGTGFFPQCYYSKL